MKDGIDAPHRPLDRLPVTDIALDEPRLRVEVVERPRRQVVENGDVVCLDERIDQVAPDEPRSARDEDAVSREIVCARSGPK
jgi:hypothetical protein